MNNHQIDMLDKTVASKSFKTDIPSVPFGRPVQFFTQTVTKNRSLICLFRPININHYST